MLKIPHKFKEKLSKEPLLDGQITSTVASFAGIYADNKLYFFPEYTNHGLEHINSVLKAAEEIIDDETIEKILTAQDIAVLILSIVLHDLGMQLSFDSFKSLIDGKNDDAKIDVLDEKKWNQLWEEYLDEARKFSGKQLRNIFGNEFHTFRKPNLNDRLNITEADKLLIGEFIRRHHPRIAHEVALKGLVGKNKETFEFARDTQEHIKKLAGIVARSHGMGIRDTFEYLQTLSEYEWANPHSINVIFLMVVLRIADYFQFDATRVDVPLLKLKTFSSPISQIEHDKHLAIDFVKPFGKDPETLYVEAKPNNSDLYLKLEKLFKDIQYELDMSWAVLGEIYGKEKNEKQPKIKYRRIKSNLEKKGRFVKSLDYVPEKIFFDYDPDLAKLLIAPLYGDNPTFGVRELLQNAIDACREREIEEKRLGNDYEPLIEVSIEKKGKGGYFTITDNGKGMTLHELKNYFLKAGSSFRKSIDWQKKYTDHEGKSEVMRSGRFGVGALAAFLLGDEIEVTTKSIHDKFSYNFKASLDSEQLNITRSVSEKSGSFIKILLNDKVWAKLKNSKRDNIDWYGWYKFKKPTIKFTKNGNILVNDTLIDKDNIPSSAHAITNDDFNKIIWQYEVGRITTCNGIIIPIPYNLPEIPRSPSIHIIDYNARLGLNLSRESIIENPNFEKDLLEDIYKDLIASIFLIETPQEIKESHLINKQLNPHPFNHPSGINLCNFYYCKDGFTIHQSFFLTNLKETFIHINICVRNQLYSFDVPPVPFAVPPAPFDLQGFPSEGIMFTLIHDYSDSYKIFCERAGDVKSYFNLHNPARIYNRGSFYNQIFNEPNKVYYKVKDNHKIDFRDDNWVVWNYLFDKPRKGSINYLNRQNILWVKEENLRSENSIYKEDYDIPLLNNLLKKYFGENYIIPYNLEDRKKMFPKAFEELEPYMRKYRNSNSSKEK